MANYKYAIEIAILVFPVIAFFITFPYMVVQYFKYGSIPFLRTVIIYSFVLNALNYLRQIYKRLFFWKEIYKHASVDRFIL